MSLQQHKPIRPVPGREQLINQFQAPQAIFRLTRTNNIDCRASCDSLLGCVQKGNHSVQRVVGNYSPKGTLCKPPLNVSRAYRCNRGQQLHDGVNNLRLISGLEPPQLSLGKPHEKKRHGSRAFKQRNHRSGRHARHWFRLNRIVEKAVLHQASLDQDGALHILKGGAV